MLEIFKIAKKTPTIPNKIENVILSKYPENRNMKTRTMLLLSIARPVYFASSDKPKVLK